jgi:hypothetical protein
MRRTSTRSRLLSAAQEADDTKKKLPKSPQDPEDQHDEGEYQDRDLEGDDDEEDDESEDEEENGSKQTRRIAVPNNGSGDRAAERDPVIAAHRDCERARIAVILRSPEAQANRRAAEAFALDSAMPRDQAIAMLRAIGPAGRNSSLFERMARSDVPRVGPDQPRAGISEDARKSTALGIVNAGRKARGEPPLADL